MFPPGIEPGTFCVLGRRDNRYTTETSSTLCLYYGLSCSLPQEELKSWRSSEGVVNKDKRCKVVKFKSHLLNSSFSYIASISSRDRLVVRTLRCGLVMRSNINRDFPPIYTPSQIFTVSGGTETLSGLVFSLVKMVRDCALSL